MLLIHIVTLAILQGFTEFLPISSSAHLILVPQLLGWSDQGLAFDLSVHLGTLMAVIGYFYADVKRLVQDGFLSLATREHVGMSRQAWAIVFGTVPAGIAGLMLLDYIDTSLRSATVIFFTTVIFGLLLGLTDYVGKKDRELNSINWKDVLIIGIAQAAALIPGTSRSGATITAGLALGLTRKDAAKFSFLLAIPITFLAVLVKGYELITTNDTTLWTPLILGCVVSFLSAIITIHLFLKFIEKFSLQIFLVYRLLLGLTIYLVLLR
ncbi:undecaprenyl-diphosphate phosphatase [uncultured Gilvimarinus sp.]|uniref:undecaprenyl-diphosphate phosphatase n=1 Tax=uncultured Gilvimarinus sp. TaxID=1689143 RepID=UPI0030DC149A